MSGRRLSRDWGKRTSLDGSGWWQQKQPRSTSSSEMTSQPMFTRSLSAPVTQDNYYSWPYAQPTVAAAPQAQQSTVSLERTTSAHDSGYHDSSNDHVTHLTDDKIAEKARSDKDGDSQLIRQRELEAVKEAVRRSKLEAEQRRNTREQEELMLQAAIAESQRLAELARSAREREQADEAQAILESRRHSLQQAQSTDRAPNWLSPPGTWAEASPTAGSSSSSHGQSLESSEMLLRSRNEKGGLWSEAGAHGWLPPGASWGAVTAEEAREADMLERAIKASLEEEQARARAEGQEHEQIASQSQASRRETVADRTQRPLSHISIDVPPAPPDIYDSNSEMYRATVTPTALLANSGAQRQATHTALLPIVTTPISPPMSPETTSKTKLRAGPVELPPYAESDPSSPLSTARSPLTMSPPTSPLLGSEALLSPRPMSSIEPSSPWDAQRSGASGSPFDLPFLMSSTSLHSLSPTRERSQHDRALTSDSLPGINVCGPGGAGLPGNATLDEERPMAENEGDPISPLMIRNPDPSELASSTLAADQATRVSRQAFLTPIFTGTTRTLSLVSERTEPPSPTSKASIHTKLSGASADADARLLASVEPTRHGSSKLRDELSSSPASDTRPGGEASESPSDYIEDGVRFGFVEREVGKDGVNRLKGNMSREAPFPTAVSLSSMTDDREQAPKLGFVVEATSWTQLLRVLMWFGDSTIAASSHDTRVTQPRRCEASLSLSFDELDSGELVVRLTAASSSVASTQEHSELRLLESTSRSSDGKGKARARENLFERAVFVLPDRLVLPARLSQVAISLHSLRQVAQIAASTVPAEDASDEFYALRALAARIKSLSISAYTAATNADRTEEQDVGLDASEKQEAVPDTPVAEEDRPSPFESHSLATVDDDPAQVAGTHPRDVSVRSNTVKTHSNGDLVERIKSRLRRLKGGTTFSSPLSPQVSHGPLALATSLPTSSASSTLSTEAYDYPDPSTPVSPLATVGHSPHARLTKPARTTVVRRRDRILLNEEDDVTYIDDEHDEFETLVDESDGARSTSVSHGTPNVRSRSHSTSNIVNSPA
ncbi:hypothetical protein ACM66B_001441 [Microbotryomycetes sp. NB124-2]